MKNPHEASVNDQYVFLLNDVEKKYKTDLPAFDVGENTLNYRPLWIKLPESVVLYEFIIREDGALWDCALRESVDQKITETGFCYYELGGVKFDVGRLVLLAFRGRSPDTSNNLVVHADCMTQNNYLSNLSWGSDADLLATAINCGKLRMSLAHTHNTRAGAAHTLAREKAGDTYTTVTRKMTFDTGHRVPMHESKCKNVHGHTWTLEVTCKGLMNPVNNEADDGMVIDYGDIKKIMAEQVVDVWDHGFIVWEGDLQMIEALKSLPDNKTIKVSMPPTSEYLAYKAFIDINTAIIKKYGYTRKFFLYSTRLHETPNCYAEYVSNCLQSSQLPV